MRRAGIRTSSRKWGEIPTRDGDLRPRRAGGVQLLGPPDLTQLPHQHELDAQRGLAVAEQVGQQRQRLGPLAGADGLGQLEDAALAALRDHRLDVAATVILAPSPANSAT